MNSDEVYAVSPLSIPLSISPVEIDPMKCTSVIPISIPLSVVPHPLLAMTWTQ